MAELPPNSKQHILDSLTENLRTDWRPVSLPSKNVLYPEKTEILIRPFGFEEEKIIASSKKSQAKNLLNVLLGRCIKGINISELLISDKIYLIFKIREISYGNDYGVDIPCEQCDYLNHLVIKINDLEIKWAPEDLKSTESFQLPEAKKLITVRYPRVSDEELLLKNEELIDHLHIFIKDIEGETDTEILKAFVRRLPAKDISRLKQVILSSERFGLDTTVKFSCLECDKSNIVSLPLTPDFFSANSEI